MGREATAACRWGERSGRVKALLESSEFIVRGEIRARVPLDAITDVHVSGELLAFSAAGEPVELELGAMVAQRWAAALLAPPPTLAHKLGITAALRLHVVGDVDDPALQEALAIASSCDAPAADADLAILRIEDLGVLDAFVARSKRRTSPPPPVWIVYTKGRAGAVGEGAIRETMRANGFMDTKVSSVSDRLTALRFVARPVVRR